MVRHHHFRFLDFPSGDKERTFAIIMTVSIQAAGFIRAQAAPQRIIHVFVGMIAQAVPFVAIEIRFQRCAQLLLRLVVRREFVIKKGQQILLRRFRAGKRGQVTRADVAPAAKGGGKAQIGDDFAQQRQIFTVDLVLQRNVGGADHQRFLLFAGNSNARDQIRQGFADPGRRFNRQVPPLFSGERLRHIGDHLPLRRPGNKVRNLFLKRLIPGGDLRFQRCGQSHEKT